MATGVFLKNREIPSGSTSIRIPFGATNERPTNPVFGVFRYNTSTGSMEYFDGTVFQQLAKSGEFNECFGRDKELLELMEILVRKQKNNPVTWYR